MQKAWLSLLIVLNVIAAEGIDLSGINFNHKYDPEARVTFDHRLWSTDSTYRLSFELQINANDSVPEVLIYHQKSYNDDSEEANKGNLPGLVGRDGNALVFEYIFKNDSIDPLLVVGVKFASDRYFFDLVIDAEGQFLPPEFYPIRRDRSKHLSPYLVEDSVISFSTSTFSFQYLYSFPPASPPMALVRSADSGFSVDTLIVDLNSLRAEPGRLYFQQSDTTSFSGVGILGVSFMFPKLVEVSQVIQPLIYLSTEEEYNELVSSDNQKLAHDKFWLNNVGDRTRAAKAIGKFFRRVEEANFLFTTYKEGWKTDMGMIYTLYGTPNVVSKTLTGESWGFRTSTGRIIEYSFRRVKNLFTDEHFVLERSEDFANTWFEQVEKWREGRI